MDDVVAERARRIAVVTVGRSDYGIYRPVLHRLKGDPAFDLRIIAGAAHVSQEFGRTIVLIEWDGFEVAAEVDMFAGSDTPEAIAKSSGLGTVEFARVYAKLRPDLLLVLGDRYEMHAAVVAAVPFALPVAHIHGGESTEGAADDLYRHAITKMSHLHFVAAEPFAKRLVQMGEEPWRVTVSGAPGLDNLGTVARLDRGALEARVGASLEPPVLLVTFHPETGAGADPDQQIGELLGALEVVSGTVVVTAPNADLNRGAVLDRVKAFAATRPSTSFIDTLGTDAYFSMLALADVMVGNSSSGIIEAPSFALPVVNIGDRQAGRLRAPNVIDTASRREAILEGITRALTPEFRASLAGLSNPYGDGHAADRIAARLAAVPLDRALLTKRFHDMPA